ncbi:CU044_5270 family protein [Streptomyces violaceusniger]|uniref:Pyruvate/2-oxoglutarate dehydrogenase complex, dihydrolipoamide acyltransferase (E2) component n=1 Tax=Streptomyces violaceusniger (strain Tu 4113) TaxID=653045 RepID=G2PEM2_STRV4|nr:CU044_5270 family protein [Streptomyces violaceusniger]AEM83503.1 pyruvate/2-oxoglutarate dehydrogenase complex, dihydrolipoamide acyltransferase (E2) component [Streptomyces violaceusniger Tu 4113]
MTDELDLLREADPVSADTGPWRDRPLNARAELLLRRLPSQDRGRRTVRRVIWSLEAAAAATVLALALTVSGTPSSAVAASRPVPLVAHASGADVSLGEIVRRARTAAEESPGKSERGSHFQSWALSMKSGEDPVTLPRESLTRWNADGSGFSLEVATDPRHPGRPVIADGTPPRAVHDGKVLSEEKYPAGINGANESYFEDPPAGASALRAYLAVWSRGADRDPAELISAIESFLAVWTPGPRQRADIVTLLSRIEGLRPTGKVTDRLGREGQAFRFTPASSGMRYLIVLDPDDGSVLDVEETITRDDPEYKLKAGDVMSYKAWVS